jgi:hypothetical protein
MLVAGLTILIVVALLIGFTAWAISRCRAQTKAYLARPSHGVIKVEDYHQTPEEEIPAQGPLCLFFDSYFDRGPRFLSAHGGGWEFLRHLTRVRPR